MPRLSEVPSIPPSAPSEIGERYKIQKQLGRGAYGNVYEALDTRTNEIVAIKNTLNIFETSTDALRALREISILRQCSHPNICRIKDVLEPKDRARFSDLWIVMEYGGWDLHKVEVNAKHIGGWSEEHIRLITYQILCALLCLKHSGIVHRDIKPSNVLLKESGDCVLVDFGLARQINKVYERENPEELISSGYHDPDKKDRMEMNDPKFTKITKDPTQHVVTRWYRAPELCMLQSTYDTPVDIWAVGCILAELLPTLDPDTQLVKPLFPGDSCFLSFEGDTLGETELKMILGSRSQLTTIFEVLGTPNESDMKFIAQETLKRVIRGLPKRAPTRLETKFPRASPLALDLLSKILVFDPTKRITVEAALKHPYFNECRNPDIERYGVNKVSCEFDSVVMIPDEKTQTNKLREFLLKEIAMYHNRK